MPRSKKGIGSHHKSGTGRNSDKVRTTPCDSRCYSRTKSHSAKHIQSRSPVIAVPPLHDSAIHPQLSSTQAPSVSFSKTTPPPKSCVAMPTHHNDTAMPVTGQPSSPPSVSFGNTTLLPHPCEMPVPHNGTTPTSYPVASPVTTLLHNQERHDHYGGIVDVTRLTSAQREEFDRMIITQYHALCNENEEPSSFVSTPPIPNIDSLSQSTISSLGTGGSRSSTFSSSTTTSSSSHISSSLGTNSPGPRISGCTVSNDAPMNSSTAEINHVAPSTTVIEPPLAQDLSNIFAASSSTSSIDKSSPEYKHAWRKAQKIKLAILAAGDTPEACSQSLSIALNHASLTPIVTITGAIVPRQFASALHQQVQKTKMLERATSNGSKRKQTEDRKAFVNVSLLSVVHSKSSPSRTKDINEAEGIQHILNCSRSTSYRRLKALAEQRARLIAQSSNTDVKWSIKPRIIRTKKVSNDLRARLLEWILKNQNVRQSPIKRDTLLIKDTETGVRRRVPKLLLECSMRQLHNELIALPDKGGLLGARHHRTNEVIISDTMLRSLVPPELRPMTDSHKIMCGCTTCNTSKYLQTSLNAWRRKHMKHMEAQAHASRSRAKASLIEDYEQYSQFVFPENEARHPRCEDAADSVLCAPTPECSLPNWKCVLRKCTLCSTIDIPDLELDTSNTAPIIMFHTYMTQYSCSQHGVVLLEKVTYYLDDAGKKHNTCWFCEQLIQAKTPNFVRGRLYEKVKLFSIQRKIGDFHKHFYIRQIEKLAYHRSYYKILGKFHVADVRQQAFASTPGDISTRSDYAEKFGFAPDGQLQSEYYDNNRTLSMEGCCLDHFLPTENVINHLMHETEYEIKPEDTKRVFHLHLSDSKLQNAATTTCHLTTLLDQLFQNNIMLRHGTMWDQTDGCGKQYRCSVAYYLLSVLSVKFQIIIDRAVDTPGHGKDVVDGFNAVQKRFLTTCLRKTSMPEVHNTVTDSDRMQINSMTEHGEVSFAVECSRLLIHRDSIGTTGDKKHAKREAKARLKGNFYHVHHDDDLLYNGIKATYKILDNRDRVKLKDFYHIRCDPDLGQGFCAMRRIPCACIACVTQLSHPWTPNIDKLLQPRYAIEPPCCKYASILRGYNKWYLTELIIQPDSTSKEEMQEMHEGVLMGMTQVSSEEIEEGLFGAFETSDSQTQGYYIVQWLGNPYTLQEQYACHAFDPPVLIPTGELVCEAKFWTPMSTKTHWYHEPDIDLHVMVKVKQVVMGKIDLQPVNETNALPRKWVGYADKNPHSLSRDDHATILDRICARENYNYTETVEDENYNAVDSESDDE